MISFINAFLLSTAALSLIPIVIHLLNRKKTRRVPFSSLRFLKELQKNKMKKLKLRQFLLLGIRCLALFLAIMAFSRPVIQNQDLAGDIRQHGKSSVVLIVDHSLSTSCVTEKGSVHEQISNKAITLLDFLKEGDEALIIYMPGIIESGFSRNFSELKAGIRTAEVSNKTANLPAAVTAAFKALQSAKNPNKELYILSDFQRNELSSDDVLDPAASHNSVKVTLIDFGTEPDNQIGIVSSVVTSKIIEKGRPVHVNVTIKNHGRQAATDRQVTLYLQGRRVAQSVFSLNRQEETTISLLITPDRTGVLQGYAEVDDDAIVGDNKSFFYFNVPRTIPVLLLTRKASDADFLNLALNPSSSQESPVQVRNATFTESSRFNLSDYAVIIGLDPPPLDDILRRRMEGFLKSRGNLILMPGLNTDILQFNQTWSAMLGLSPIREKIEITGTGKSFVEFGDIDRTHPIISGLFEKNTAKAIESPQFRRFYKLAPSAGSRSVIQLSTHTDFIQEYRFGTGRVMMWSSPPDLEWNDLPLRGIFAPLLSRTIYYLNSEESANRFICGEPFELSISGVAAGDVKVEGYGGEGSLIPKVRRQGETALVSAPEVTMPGNYRIVAGNEPIGYFDANMAPDESDLTKLDAAAVSRFFAGCALQTVTEASDIEKYILQSRFGSELWKWFIAAVLLLLLTEMLLAQSHRFEKIFRYNKDQA